MNPLSQGWQTFWTAWSQIVFEEILLCTRGNFEEQNEALEPSIIIISYCIIINAYDNYII